MLSGSTSGEERAAFWKGTGEYSTGTSALVKDVKKNLENGSQKRGIIIQQQAKFSNMIKRIVNQKECSTFKVKGYKREML